MEKNIFITFEGIDGSGKSTQIALLRKMLEAKGFDILVTREPGESHLGQQIRTIILNPENPEPPSDMAEVFLFMADRNQHVCKIVRPFLEEKGIVISDRYTDSTIAYQGYGRGINIETLHKLNNIATEGLKPDITFVLDITPAKGATRARQATHEFGAADRIENEESTFHTQVSNGFKEIALQEPDRVKIIDANREIKLIHNDIHAHIETLLTKRGHDA